MRWVNVRDISPDRTATPDPDPLDLLPLRGRTLTAPSRMQPATPPDRCRGGGARPPACPSPPRKQARQVAKLRQILADRVALVPLALGSPEARFEFIDVRRVRRRSGLICTFRFEASAAGRARAAKGRAAGGPPCRDRPCREPVPGGGRVRCRATRHANYTDGAPGASARSVPMTIPPKQFPTQPDGLAPAGSPSLVELGDGDALTC